MSRQKEFQFRAFVSVLSGFLFTLLIVTGIVLFITPPGRIANWTGWTFWHLSKHEWIDLHICFSGVFLLAGLVHLWLNIKPMMRYFVQTAHTAKQLRWEPAAAMILCGVVFWGAMKPFVPFRSLLNLNERAKFSWEKPTQQAPIPHAELLTIAELASKAGLEADVIQFNLRNNGIEVGWDDVFGDIAKQHHLSPNELFAIATGTHSEPQNKGRHGNGGGGFGPKTLRAVCEEMNRDVDQAIETLKAAGIEATADKTIRQIADKNNVHPSKIRQCLQENN